MNFNSCTLIPNFLGLFFPANYFSLNSALLLNFGFLLTAFIVIVSTATLIFLKIFFKNEESQFIIRIKDQEGSRTEKINFEVISFNTAGGKDQCFGLRRLEGEVQVQIFENSYFNYFTHYWWEPLSKFKVIIPQNNFLPFVSIDENLIYFNENYFAPSGSGEAQSSKIKTSPKLPATELLTMAEISRSENPTLL